MVDWITKIIELAKVPTKLIGSICIASGILLIFPNDWLQKLHLSDFSKDFGKYIGATFLLTCATLCIEAFLWLSKSYRIKREKSHAEKKAIMALYNLDDKEIAVLREFFIQGQNTLQLPVGHPVVAGLIEKGILEQVGMIGENSLVGPLFSLSIP